MLEASLVIELLLPMNTIITIGTLIVSPIFLRCLEASLVARKTHGAAQKVSGI
jgi:hypothetical protein